MSKTLNVTIVSLIAGICLGLYAPVLLSDGRHGVQWDFNDAARSGDVREMERLIAKGADPLVSPTWAGGGGSYPLVEAAESAELEAVEFLIEKGANVNFVQATEKVLERAIGRKNDAEKCVELLKAHGARPLDSRD